MAVNYLEFNSSVEAFLKYLKRNNYSDETSRGYEKDLEFFYRYMKSFKRSDKLFIENIDKDDLTKFMDYARETGHKVNTIARRISTLKSFYKFLVFELDYAVDVAAKIKVPKTYIPLPQILSEVQVKLLLEKSGELSLGYELLFSLLYYTGSRLTPVRTLEASHVYLSERVLYFPRVKGGKDLYLPLHDHLAALVDTYFSQCLESGSKYIFPSKKVPGQPISPADVRMKLKKAAHMAGLTQNVTPHLLRHCTATHLTINNVEQRKIASILGHSDLRSTMRYQHLSVDHLRDSINKL